MHSLRRWQSALAFACAMGRVRGAVVPPAEPTITPKPEVDEIWMKRQIPDAISFAQLLLTAIPLSLRQIAATNAPAVSSLLSEEFLDDKRPQWFLDLPWDVQSYLVRNFGPATAWLPASPTTSATQLTPTDSVWSWPTVTISSQTSQPIASSTIQSSMSDSSTLSTSTMSSVESSSSSSSKTFTITSTTKTMSPSISASLVSASGNPDSPPASSTGLTSHQKIALGVGIPLGLLGVAALLLGCCFLLRRRRNKGADGREPPSSPGFIPRFAFQDKSTDNLEHRRPLNPPRNHSTQDLGIFDWEEDGIDPFEPAVMDTAYHGHTIPPVRPAQTAAYAAPVPVPVPVPVPAPAPAPPAMAMHDPEPIMAPAPYHTHSSNRARGKRTSYSSLHSVAEVSEPDENMESPILGRHATPLQRKRRPSMPMVLEMPPAFAATQSSIKRKPVPSSPQASNPAADLASQSLLRPTLSHPDHSGSSSSGLALSTNSSTYANPDYSTTSPISPLSEHNMPFSTRAPPPHTASSNPFGNEYSYIEDYGPEYHSGYIDANDGLYGHTSLSRYPDPTSSSSSPARRSSKTEWPLRNFSIGRKREKSPLWDRVYESP